MWPYYKHWNPAVFGWHRNRWWFPPFDCASAPISDEEEIAMLEEQACQFESELKSIKKRLAELKKKEVQNA
jgi:hypothetical protein